MALVNMGLRILNAEPEGYDPKAKAVLQTIGQLDEAWSLPVNELAERLKEYDILIVRLKYHVGRTLLAATDRVKVVVSATTGINHLDLDYLDSRGIAALTLRGETEFLRTITATAEHAWALLLALRRRIIAAAEMGASGIWERDQLRGHELSGSTLGIVGCGRLGLMVARYGQAFGMKILIYDPYVQPEIGEKTPSLIDLFARSDVISVHVPLNDETHGLISRDVLACCKPGAVLINTARGEVIDEQALLDALRSGRLGGAGLDVLAGELSPDLADHPLVVYARQHDHLLITPHIGGATYESMAKTERFMAHKLYNFCSQQGWV